MEHSSPTSKQMKSKEWRSGDPSWTLYAGGYKRAADLLVEYGVSYGEQHILVYPTVFLYRHYFELQLKEIMQNGYSLLDIPKHFPKGPKGHRVDELWRECRDILKRIDEEEYKKLGQEERRKYEDDINAVDRCISLFSGLDPDSTAFRYPCDKSGNPSISGPFNVSFRALKELVERISSLLESISVGISVYLDAKHDLDSQT